MNDILNTILINTYSLAHLRHRLSTLKTYLEQQFFAGQSPKDLTQIDINWISSLPPTFLNNFNKDNLRAIFEDLQKQIPKLPCLTLYLTFDPKEASIQQIGEFARKTFGQPYLLLDIKYDPTLIAGASLVWKGIYKDYSLRSKIDARKGEVLESFKKFLR